MKGRLDPGKKSYKSSIKLTEYMEKKLQHFKDLEKIERKKYAGEDLEELKNAVAEEYGDINTEKTRLLDGTIFPSMANLIVFFEYLTKYPQLRELFEKDVKALFGYFKGPWYNETEEDGKTYKYRFKPEPGHTYWIVNRLVKSLLTWDMKKDPNNFRLHLVAELQKITSEIIRDLARLESDGFSGVDNIINTQMAQAESWTKLYASRYDKSKQAEEDRGTIPKRPVSF